MPARPPRAILLLPVVLAVLTSGCILFPPPFGSPGEVRMRVENTTDANWVLRIANAYEEAFAIPAGETGSILLYGGPGTEAELLTDACQPVDELALDDGDRGLRIGDGGELSVIAASDGADRGLPFAEYYDCMAFGGGPPRAGEAVAAATGTLFIVAGGDLWELDPATATLTQLTTTEEFEEAAALSPDGGSLAVVRYGVADDASGLYVVAAGGGDARLVAEVASAPAWSPDGARLAYLDGDPFGGGSVLRVVDADGGEPLLVARNGGAGAWSPDGTRIAFLAASEDDPFATGAIRIVTLDGAEPVTLAEDAPAWGMPPAWSPDGRRIAYAAGGMGGGPFGGSPDGEIRAVDLGGRAVVLATVPESFVDEPAWSPDGRQVAFTVASASAFSTSGALAVVPADGGEPRLLAERDGSSYWNLRWSPDGRQLAAVRTDMNGMTSELVLVDVGSGAETVVATGELSLAAWSR